MKKLAPLTVVAAVLMASNFAGAHEIASQPSKATHPAFDIVKTDIRVERDKR